MSIAQRSIDSVSWNAVTSLIKIPVGLVQSILLARYLPVAYFGIYGGVVALTTLVNGFFEFGLHNSFIHRTEETLDEGKAIAVLFTLRFALESIQALIFILIAVFFFSDLRQLALIVVVIGGYLVRVFSVPKTLLARRIQFKRLALMELISSIITATASIVIAWTTASIWALLVSSITTFVWIIIALYVWKPVWRPRFEWDASIVRYYFNFGGRVQIANTLNLALDNVDDLWTNLFLGDLPLGFYSRSYKFATYPRMVVALPLQTVANSTFAELKEDRKRLSQSFFRVSALLARAGFLLAGWLAVIAPQLIRILLGERWLPMLDAFRLMLVFALFDPLKGVMAGLLVTQGKPQKVITARTIQLAIMVAGLFILGLNFGIVGVALAVDLMLVVGIAILLHFIKPYVDFSLRRLFLVPLFSLTLAIFLTWLVFFFWDVTLSDWIVGLIKSALFLFTYGGILYLLEGKVLYQSFKEIVELSAWKQQWMFLQKTES